MRLFVAVAVPAIVALVNLPLALGFVPPNQWYGFRTARTLSAHGIWYRANRIASLLLIIAAAVSIAINALLIKNLANWPNQKLLLLMSMVLPPLLICALAVAHLYIRRLPPQ